MGFTCSAAGKFDVPKRVTRNKPQNMNKRTLNPKTQNPTNTHIYVEDINQMLSKLVQSIMQTVSQTSLFVLSSHFLWKVVPSVVVPGVVVPGVVVPGMVVAPFDLAPVDLYIACLHKGAIMFPPNF